MKNVINRALVAKKKSFTLFVALLIAVGAMAQKRLGENPLSGYQSQKNINYVGDGHQGHLMDIYYPNDNSTTHPVIIHIYGSGWSNNNFKQYADLSTVGVAALEAGYIFVTPNHRAYTDALFPAQLHDIKALVRYLRGNAQSLGIDASFIVVSGFSSGGHLAALMGVTNDLNSYTVGSETIDVEGSIGNYGNQSSSVDAVCAWTGLIEMRGLDGCEVNSSISPFMKDLVGRDYSDCPDRWALASPATYVSANAVPTVLFHGSDDALNPTCISQNFYNNLTNAGVDCELFLHNGGHSVNADYTDDMITFCNRIKAAKQTEDLQLLPLDNNAPNKLIHDGQLLIQHNGSIYNALGTPIR
jgi:acetyl esterase/lipase